jgi:hypothetical protein
LPDQLSVREIDSRVGAGRKSAADVGVAIITGFVADVIGAGNFRWGQDGARETGAGNEKQHQTSGDRKNPSLLRARALLDETQQN